MASNPVPGPTLKFTFAVRMAGSAKAEVEKNEAIVRYARSLRMITFPSWGV
ncbi:hypothetical protein D3C71_1919280 [compost metagenome]